MNGARTAAGKARGPSRAALALLLGSLAACSCGHEPAPPAADGAAAADALLRGDRRVGELLGPCSRNGFYDRDLSDVVPVLLEKLEFSRPDSLKRAKEELGQLGEASFPALANFFQRNYADMMRSALVENAVDAMSFSLTDAAHVQLLQALVHPQESVRLKSLDGLRRNSRPADFELLLTRLPLERADLRRALVSVLFACDRERAEDFVLQHIELGDERDLWLVAAPLLAASRDEDTARRCGELFERTESVVAIHLAACAARAGNGPAVDRLRADLRDDAESRRVGAVNAATRAGLGLELEHSLLEDPSRSVRTLSIQGVAGPLLAGEGPLGEPRRTWLRAALNDEASEVQAEVLRILCLDDDPEALARALTQLEADGEPLQAALVALRDPLHRDRELAQRALAILEQRHRLEEHRPVQQRVATFKALGQVPLREAAALLRRVGVEAGDQRIESLRAHDWLMIQASNTGPEGRRFLAEELERERDPLRRIDLIDAVGSDRDDLARDALLAVAEDTDAAPLERLFAANAAARVGPSWEVAPRLKRVSYGMEKPAELEARTALQCLLWSWY